MHRLTNLARTHAVKKNALILQPKRGNTRLHVRRPGDNAMPKGFPVRGSVRPAVVGVAMD